ncbi:MAG: hypothetical protein EOP88_10090 [Verrucomicrobiaceae bacterium]|nr:MAG: hypothetical protein EOP88_10090 [Verrucomicrobiaceae bacterium]
MKIDSGRNIGIGAAVIVAGYLIGYLALRQTATPGTIFITPPGAKASTGQPYRAIVLNPTVAKWVHKAYWPLIALDRKWTNTVVTVNIS